MDDRGGGSFLALVAAVAVDWQRFAQNSIPPGKKPKRIGRFRGLAHLLESSLPRVQKCLG